MNYRKLKEQREILKEIKKSEKMSRIFIYKKGEPVKRK